MKHAVRITIEVGELKDIGSLKDVFFGHKLASKKMFLSDILSPKLKLQIVKIQFVMLYRKLIDL